MSSDGLMWYMIGMALGVVIGMPGTHDLVTKLDRDFRDAAGEGRVSAEDHCAQLQSLNDRLNEYYAKHNKTNPQSFTVDCAALTTPRP